LSAANAGDKSSTDIAINCARNNKNREGGVLGGLQNIFDPIEICGGPVARTGECRATGWHGHRPKPL
jgi:hypothetical protein